MSKKQARREKARLRELKMHSIAKPSGQSQDSQQTESKNARAGPAGFLRMVYEDHYKKLIIFTFLMLLLAFAQIGYQAATTGEFIKKGVTLKGGITISVHDTSYDSGDLHSYLKSSFPSNDITVRTLTGVSGSRSLTIEADVTSSDEISRLESEIEGKLGITSDSYSTNFIGSSLGSNFFRQTVIALIIAFAAMGLVVFIYFRVPIPSLAVVLSAFCGIVETVAIINILDIKISTGGIAALLMLIGYSVDTDILLTTRVFRSKEDSLMASIYSSAKTGLTMTLTSLAAVIIAIIFSQSEGLRQIMTILLIGLILDLPNTWIQNAGILRWYIERKKDAGD